ncbi:cytochrome c [Limibacter armeniacum]|uniref:c-type cytochrome n=1 Tax=Limibacter armeniacum TaxID=466084 RepID=UPI002FE67778
MRINKILLGLLAGAAVMTGCTAEGNDPGVEYAPQMYVSIPYEPLTQVTNEGVPTGLIEGLYEYYTNSTPYNDYKGKQPMNEMLPVEGTVARQNYSSVTKSLDAKPDQPLLYYKEYGKNDLEKAAAELQNPLPDSKDIVKEGKHLFEAYCQPCHGAAGDGQGKVGKVYLGVANLKGKAIVNATDGHIFHVITHGKGRMWSHKSQLNPEQRWKIVKYVRDLQGK